MTYKLIFGDCLEVMSTLEAGSIDAIITDLPYGTTKCKWDTIIPFDEMWQGVKHCLKKNGVFVTTSNQPFTSFLVISNLKWFKYEWIYNKTKGVGYLNSKKMPITNHENVIVFSEGRTTYNPQFSDGIPYKKVHRNEKEESTYGKSTRKNGDLFINDGYRYPTTSIKSISNPSGRGQLHSTQKPVSLYEYLIKTYTNEGETVLDIAMGSGTTIEAAERTGRNSIGIEKDEKIFETAKNRIESIEYE